VSREVPADAPSSRWLAPEAITKRDLGVPPTLDLVQHLRDLRRVAIPAALIAVLLAGLVFFARAGAPPAYGATALARVNTGTSTSANTTDAMSTLQASYAQALTDPAVLNTIMNRSNAPWTLRQAKDRITLSPGPSAGLVQVNTLGDSRAEASAVAEQTVLALGAAVRQRRLQDSAQATTELRATAADLNAKLAALAPTDPTRARVDSDYQAAVNQIVAVENAGLVDLAPLANPTVADGPVSPNPLRDAAVALLAGFLVLAELLVAARGRLGSKLRIVAARRIAARFGAGVQEVGRPGADDATTIRTEVLAARLLDAGADVLVLRGPGLAEGAGLDVAGLRPGPAADGARRGRVVELDAQAQWWRSADLNNVRLAVLSLARGSKTKDLGRRTLRALADSDIPAVLALVHQPRRKAARAVPVAAVPVVDVSVAAEQPELAVAAPASSRKPASQRTATRKAVSQQATTPPKAPARKAPARKAAGATAAAKVLTSKSGAAALGKAAPRKTAVAKSAVAPKTAPVAKTAATAKTAPVAKTAAAAKPPAVKTAPVAKTPVARTAAATKTTPAEKAPAAKPPGAMIAPVTPNTAPAAKTSLTKTAPVAKPPTAPEAPPRAPHSTPPASNGSASNGSAVNGVAPGRESPPTQLVPDRPQGRQVGAAQAVGPRFTVVQPPDAAPVEPEPSQPAGRRPLIPGVARNR